MKLVHRFAYYFGGFAIGLLFLFFVLNRKNASCDYFPDARVLKNIRTTKLAYSQKALEDIQQYKFDTTQVAVILENGDVDFSRSNVHSDSCNTYLVTGNSSNQFVEMFIENCDSLATILNVEISEKEQ